jgi:hypothetical protein
VQVDDAVFAYEDVMGILADDVAPLFAPVVAPGTPAVAPESEPAEDAAVLAVPDWGGVV